MDADGRYWRGISVALADDVLSLARRLGLTDDDLSVQRARNAQEQSGLRPAASRRAPCPRGEERP